MLIDTIVRNDTLAEVAYNLQNADGTVDTAWSGI